MRLSALYIGYSSLKLQKLDNVCKLLSLQESNLMSVISIWEVDWLTLHYHSSCQSCNDSKHNCRVMHGSPVGMLKQAYLLGKQIVWYHASQAKNRLWQS